MTREIYALSKDRTLLFASRFLNTFVPKGAPFAEEFPIPECSDAPTHVFCRVEEVMEFLEANPFESYAVYWNGDSYDERITQAMLFYTQDNYLIIGLASYPEFAEICMQQLKEFAQTDYAIYGDEQRPPETAVEFKALCRQK